jgi:hypothetical protein
LDPFAEALAAHHQRLGHSRSEAVDLALTACFDWHEGLGDVSPETRARATKAIDHLTAIPRASR